MKNQAAALCVLRRIKMHDEEANGFEPIPEDPRENLTSSIFDANSFVSLTDIDNEIKNNKLRSTMDSGTLVCADTCDTNDPWGSPELKKQDSLNSPETPKTKLPTLNLKVRKVKTAPASSLDELGSPPPQEERTAILSLSSGNKTISFKTPFH